MADAPDFDARAFDARLARHAAWQPVRHFASTDSTQARLRDDFAQHAALDGAWRVAIADMQTAGRGRTGAAWQARPGAALLMTVGAVLPASPLWLPRASLVAGLAVADVLAARGVSVAVKWPNDLLIRTQTAWHKLGGILCERVGGACGDPVWLCGVGLNVEAAPPDVPHAVALRDLGVTVTRTDLALELCLALRAEVSAWLARRGMLDTLRLDARLAFLGATVELDLGELQGRRRVRLDGVDATGALRVRTLDAEARWELVQPLRLTAADADPPWSV